jgi:hypothetical protein
VRKAYQRPVDAKTVDRLVTLAENTYTRSGKTFEAGIAQAMVAVLASPRFLFREEATEPSLAGQTYPFVDEYSLASRLSYFLWSSMPDDELQRLAGAKQLRANLTTQFERMLSDPRSDALTKNFVGQWLQSRDIESVSIDARRCSLEEAARTRTRSGAASVSTRAARQAGESLTADEKDELEKIRKTFFRRNGAPLRAELNGDLRQAMRQETEKTFEYILREDRRLLELIDSDYTFLNERLAKTLRDHERRRR